MASKLFEFRATRGRRGGLAVGIAYRIWDDQAATVPAEIYTLVNETTPGALIGDSTVTTADIAGLGPAAVQFFGPADGQDTLWVTCPADPTLGVQETQAAVDPRLDALEAAVIAGGIPASIFDAKGDLIAASAADTAARLAVGANDTVLTADSAQTTGLKWATGAGGAASAKPRGAWAASVAYALNDVVVVNGGTYRALSAHTSQGTFPGTATGVWERWARADGVYYVDDYGATHNGGPVLLSTRFASLGAAQAAYPHVTALTQTVDWAASQAAVNAALATRGGRQSSTARVHWARGEYIIGGDSITVEHLNRIHLSGDGSAVTSIRLSADLPAEDATGKYGIIRSPKGSPCYHWSIRGMTLDGEEFKTYSANDHGLVAYDIQQIGILEDVCIQHVGGYGFWAGNDPAVTNASGLAQIRDCWFNDCLAGHMEGDDPTGVATWLVLNTHFERTEGDCVHGFLNTFINCHFEFGRYGVYNNFDLPNTLIGCDGYASGWAGAGNVAEPLAFNFGPADLIDCYSTGWVKLNAANVRDIVEVSGRTRGESFLRQLYLGPYLQVDDPTRPDSITDIRVWLKADAITGVADGGAVTTWSDSSGNGYHATQATANKKPTLQTNEINGLPVVRFDGSSGGDGDILKNATMPNEAQPITMFVVAKQAALASRALVDDNGTGSFTLVLDATGHPAIYAGAVVTSGTVAPATTTHLYRAIFNGASSSVAIDGVATAGNAGATGITGGYTIGANGVDTAAWWNGDIGEVLIFGTALTADQIAAVESYLANKWGLTVSGGLGVVDFGLADLSLRSAGTERLRVTATGDLQIPTVGKGLQVKEGSNAKMGTAVLVAGAATVATTAVTANSRILVTSQVDGGAPGFLRVSTRTAGTSFVVTSSSATDTSTVAWLILEPA